MDQLIHFKNLQFQITEGRIYLTSFGGMRSGANQASLLPLTELQTAGGNAQTVCPSLTPGSSESRTLRYVSHKVQGNRFTILERNERWEVKTCFIAYPDANAIAVEKSVKNIAPTKQTMERVCSLLLNGVGAGIDHADQTYFYAFTQSHHAECQPWRITLSEVGFFRSFARNFKKLSFANIGSWSSKAQLPQGIIENHETGDFLMFQIESNHNWYYEISAIEDDFYLALSGNASPEHRYAKTLLPNQVYHAPRVAFCSGKNLNDVMAQMTLYRRQIAKHSHADKTLPVIFNEYMHLSWDHPTEANTREYAKAVALAGAKYYVIDCGWHDDVPDGVWVYPYMGRWKESKKNFPHGLRQTTDYLRSLGLKAGLWIEPEIVGIHCREMLDYYDDDCFLKRNGERICVSDKYLLDFRQRKVRSYLNETIRRMVEDYGADYIKMDYNVDAGFVDGDFEAERNAYLAWVDGIQEMFPNVLMETCSSGGMRMDYETLKHFSLVSTSDQTDDTLYPYIAGNILSAVLPEQAAVWSYPVSNLKDTPSKETVAQEVSLEKVALNMINSMLGRTHLSSNLSLLNEKQFALVKEGVMCLEKLNAVKPVSVPYFPLGFTDFSKDTVACGLKVKGTIYLAVWVLRGNQVARIPLPNGKEARVIYPRTLKTDLTLENGILTISLPTTNAARLLEIKDIK